MEENSDTFTKVVKAIQSARTIDQLFEAEALAKSNNMHNMDTVRSLCRAKLEQLTSDDTVTCPPEMAHMEMAKLKDMKRQLKAGKSQTVSAMNGSKVPMNPMEAFNRQMQTEMARRRNQ